VVAVLAEIHFNPDRPLARTLSLAPLRFVGRISYGLYLWHYPIFIWLNAERSGLHGVTLLAARFVLTFVVATASFYLVERPIRYAATHRRVAPKVAWVSALAATVAITFALTGVAAAPAAPVPPARIALSHPLSVLIVGDSVAFSLAYWGSPWAQENDVVVHSAAIPGCGLMPFTWGSHHGSPLYAASYCRYGPASKHGYLTLWKKDLALWHPDVVVILAGRWEEHTLYRHHQLESIQQPSFYRELEHRMVTAAQVAGSTGAAVVWSTSPCSASGETAYGSPWIEDSPTRLHLYNGLVFQVARQWHESVFNLNSLVCHGGVYHRVIGGVVIRSVDGVHFAPTGGEWVMARLDRFLLRVTHHGS
jgi:hypothetical protein